MIFPSLPSKARTTQLILPFHRLCRHSFFLSGGKKKKRRKENDLPSRAHHLLPCDRSRAVPLPPLPQPSCPAGSPVLLPALSQLPPTTCDQHACSAQGFSCQSPPPTSPVGTLPCPQLMSGFANRFLILMVSSKLTDIFHEKSTEQALGVLRGDILCTQGNPFGRYPASNVCRASDRGGALSITHHIHIHILSYTVYNCILLYHIQYVMQYIIKGFIYIIVSHPCHPPMASKLRTVCVWILTQCHTARKRDSWVQILSYLSITL